MKKFGLQNLMFVLLILGTTATVSRAQAPAGPNRPPQVPEEYVVTPFGYFHPSCVVRLAESEELLEGGRMIQRADGTIYTVPVCEYPHYTAHGERFAAGSKINPPTISHDWILSGSTSTTTSYGEILANWNVPSAPLSYDSQTIYFFSGLEDYNRAATILQPVLGWNSDFRREWGIASWNCCPFGTADESWPVRVNTGDLIVGTVKSTCGSGTLSCPRWKITTQDNSTGESTTLNNTPSEGQTFNWAFGGVLEVYNVVRCSNYPPDQYITFYPTLFDNNFSIIDNPSWSLTDLSSGLTPQCQYGGQVSSSAITLAFGSFTLTVSLTGDGYVTSTDGSINCPGTCMQTFQAGTQTTLNATPDNGWVFTGWSGGCSGTGSCQVDMTQDHSVTAHFSHLYTLNVIANGNGTVTSTDGFINCPGTCTHVYLSNTPVTLNATPAFGWSFNGWGGACNGTGSCNLTMTQNQSVSATFTQDHYTLTVSTSGSGIVTSSDGFINCPGTCSHTYFSATQVTLNASPAQGWTFSGWTGACSGVGSCNLIIARNLSVTAIFVQPGNGLQFLAVTPCRLLDTRQTGNPIQGGTSQDFALTQLGNCHIPATAAAYSLNITVLPYGRLGYLTIWPAGQAQPNISTINSSDGRIKADAAIVQAGTNSAVSVHVSDTSNILIDIDGYFTAASDATLAFYPLTPCRVVDTRNTNGELGGPFLQGNEERDFPVQHSSCIPQGVTAAAYSFNFTAVPHPTGQRLGYLSVWPVGEQQPVVSTLNNPTGTIVANAAIVPAGTDGAIAVYPNNDTDLLIDIDGYFAAPGTGGLSLYPTAACRVFDTRNNNGLPFSGELTVNVVNSICAPPSTAQAYVFNATVVPPGALGYLTLWPDGQNQPLVSTLNATDGAITSNMAIVPTNNGSIDAYASALTQLILDISSYFAP